jgi:hypothetical protein
MACSTGDGQSMCFVSALIFFSTGSFSTGTGRGNGPSDDPLLQIEA